MLDNQTHSIENTKNLRYVSVYLQYRLVMDTSNTKIQVIVNFAKPDRLSQRDDDSTTKSAAKMNNIVLAALLVMNNKSLVLLRVAVKKT